MRLALLVVGRVLAGQDTRATSGVLVKCVTSKGPFFHVIVAPGTCAGHGGFLGCMGPLEKAAAYLFT